MSTLRKMQQGKTSSGQSTLSARSTKKTMRRWKAALIGLLLTLTVTISGCGSTPVRPVPQEDLVVDASLMSPSNYTSQLLSVLSE